MVAYKSRVNHGVQLQLITAWHPSSSETLGVSWSASACVPIVGNFPDIPAVWMGHEGARDARAAGIVLPTVGPLGAALRLDMRGGARLFSLRVEDS